VLVPVPAHARRLRGRGFNQAERIAAALGRRTGLRVNDCLVRSRPVAPQTGRRRAERVAAAAGTVALRRGARAPARALIVDDVITTAATIGACAEALLGAGCGRVQAVSCARTPGR
jgi:predicted amidophosphoribosyltransferase